MKTRKYITEISEDNIDINNFNEYKINKNKSILYRCKFCRRAKLRKEKKKIYKIRGHDSNCILLKRKFSEKQNKNNNITKSQTNFSIPSIKLDKNDIHYIFEDSFESYINNEYNMKSNNNNNSTIFQHNENNKIQYSNQLSLLSNVFDKQNCLSKNQITMGIYYYNKEKILGEGAYSKTFLGEDKFLRINVAILQMNADDEEKFDLEIFVLQRIHGKGNFPLLYNTYSDEDANYFYLVESLMGPTLKSLYKLCDQIFDFYTIINIAIDLIKNIKILHDFGFLHRDLKPDNLAYGNLSYENYYSKNEIGIIDFSNSKINLFPNGKIRYSKRIVKCAGNKFYSSPNALKDKDTGKKDDLISIFYILIYFFRQDLPWKIKHSNGNNLSKKEILEIMENTSIKALCGHISFDFLNLTEYIFNLQEKEDPDYDYILKELNKMKLKEENQNNFKKEKFCWLKLLKTYIDKPSEICKNKKNQIESLFNKYGIKLKEYIKYIDN